MKRKKMRNKNSKVDDLHYRDRFVNFKKKKEKYSKDNIQHGTITATCGHEIKDFDPPFAYSVVKKDTYIDYDLNKVCDCESIEIICPECFKIQRYWDVMISVYNPKQQKYIPIQDHNAKEN